MNIIETIIYLFVLASVLIIIFFILDSFWGRSDGKFKYLMNLYL